MDTSTTTAPSATGTRRTADALRGLAAAGVLLSAVIHLDLWVQGMSRLDVVGPMFLLNAVAGIALGVVLLVWRHWLPLLASVAFGGATLVAAVLSTLPGGFFGVHETWGNAIFALSGAADVAALAFAAAAWVVGVRSGRRGRP